jgi:hypothetical protein
MDVDALVERLNGPHYCDDCCGEPGRDGLHDEAAAALLALRDDVAKWQGIAAREASHGAEVWEERDALRAEREPK